MIRARDFRQGAAGLMLAGAAFLAGGFLPAATPARGGGEAASAKANQHPAYARLRSLTPDGTSVAVQNLVLKRDVATFTFTSGEFFLLPPVEDRVTGAVFIGQGEFRLTPALPSERRHLRWLTEADEIRETFNRLVLRFADGTAEEIRSAGQVRTSAQTGAAADLLANHRSRLKEKPVFSDYNVGVGYLQYNLDLRLLQDLTWPGRNGLFHAWFEGARLGELLYVVDPLGAPAVEPEEVALVALSDSALGIWVAEPLEPACRPDAPPAAAHRLIDAEHYDIDATVRGKRLEAKARFRFQALVDGLRTLPLDLFPKLRMRKVTDGQGRELFFVQEDKDKDAGFGVILEEPLRKGEKYELLFEYAGDDAIDDSGRGNYSLVARHNWYPSLGLTDRATFAMTLRAPKDLTMVATGQPAGQNREGDWTVSRWTSDVPILVAGFNFGAFKKSSVRDDKLALTIESYTNKDIPDDFQGILKNIEEYERSTGQNAEVTLGTLNTTRLMEKARAEAQVALSIFTQLYGPLPFDRLALAQQPYPFFGQAWPMLVYIPLAAFFDGTHRAQLGLAGAANFYNYVAAHETSHQWWGHAVGWRSYRDQWLSEGFATFSAAYFVQAVYGKDKFLEYWREERQAIMARNRQGRRPAEVGGVTMGYRLDTAKTGAVTQAAIYSKGGYIVHMLRMMMWDPKTGDARFQAMMQDFVRSCYQQNASTADFKRVLEKHLTPDMDLDGNGRMDWFFRQWVEGTTIPRYKLDYRLEPAEGGKTRLFCQVTQSGVDADFKMRVPIYLEFDGAVHRLGVVTLVGNSTLPEFDVVLPKKPKRALLCAYEDVLCEIGER